MITLTHLRDPREERPTVDAGSDVVEEPGDAEALGDRGAFDVTDAYGRYGGEIFGFAVNAVHDRDVAQDCVQETFVRAWRARDRFDPARAAVRTWLYAIARNVVTDSHRRRARLPEPVAPERLPERAAAPADPVDRLTLMAALETLTPEHRQVVVAVHLVGLTYAELSQALDVPVATLRTRTYYGLRALRRHLEQGEGQ